MGFNIVAPYMEFLHLNWCFAELFYSRNILQDDTGYTLVIYDALDQYKGRHIFVPLF